MTIPECISCKSKEIRKLHRYRTITNAEARFFRDGYLWQCTACQLIQLFPRPSEARLVDFYRSSYRNENDADAWEQASRIELASGGTTGLVELLRQFALAPRIVLDVGAGVGNHSRSAQSAFRNAQVWCVEPSDVFASRLRAAGLRTISKPWPEAAQDFHHKADAVILSHVLEHFLNPRALLETLVDVMVPGGWLAIEVPNDPDWQVHAADHSPHISFFTQTSLRALLSNFGEVLFLDTAGRIVRPRRPYWQDAVLVHFPTIRAIRAKLKLMCSRTGATPGPDPEEKKYGGEERRVIRAIVRIYPTMGRGLVSQS